MNGLPFIENKESSMEGLLLSSLLCNGFLCGVVVIMFRGLMAMNREIRMLKHFTSAMIDFTEEETNKTTKEVQTQFTKYMERQARNKAHGGQ